MKTNWVENFFHEKENPENLICLMIGYKKCTRTFLGSLYNQTIVKYVFHEILWNKYFTVYPRLIEHQWLLSLNQTYVNSYKTCDNRSRNQTLILAWHLQEHAAEESPGGVL